ncbi:MAG: T9SS type A sorting domain-containing protein [Bacteroidota bacterium]
MYLSSDNGGTFSTWNSGLSSVTTVYTIVLKGSFLFLGTNNGIYKATAGTNSWALVSSSMGTVAVKSLFVAGSTLYAGTLGSTTGIYKTINDGSTWTPVTTGIPLFSNVNCFAAAGANIFAGTDVGVFSTINGGGLWSPINTGLVDSTITVMATSANYLWVGTNSQGVWRRQLSQLYTGISQSEPETTFTLSPNPFNQSTQITLNKTYQNITLEIYDIQGKLMLQKEYSDKDKILLESEGLNNGMYFLKLPLDGKMVETRKMVVSE